MGVFVNTVTKTLMVGVSGTHWLYKNDFRFSRRWFPLLASKWSYNIAIGAIELRRALDGAVGKP